MIRFSHTLVLLTFILGACATDDTPERSNNGVDSGVDAGTDTSEEVLDLRSLLPAQGNVSGGTTVTLSGRGFQSGMTVTFANTPGTSVVVLTSRQATVVTPATTMPAAVDVVATNPDNTTSTLPGAFTFVEALDPQIGFCQLQAQSPATALIGQDFPALFAIAFMEGVTQGEGQGAGIEAELGWGNGDPAQFAFTPMTYNVDKDGLAPGDLSNDEYGATLEIPTTGEFSYIARMRVQGRPDWVYCDLDGSENGADTPGIIRVSEAQMPTISFCQLQAQSPASAITGEDSERLYAFVYAEGLTPGDGQGSGITGELGWGVQGATPQDFNWTAATYNVDIDGATPGDKANDEYGAKLKASTAGSYDYLARFKTSTGDWLYCDLDGSSNGSDDRGTLDVVDPVLPTIGFCSTQTAQVSNLSGQPSTAIRGAVFVAGVTNGAGAGAGIISELRYGATGSAPNTWSGTVTGTYAEDADGLNQGDLANDVYTSVIPAQTQGDYDYAYRFSLDGGMNWTWCDTSGSPPFDANELGLLETRDVVVNLPDTCRLQFPAVVTSALVGQSVTVFGRVTEGVITGTGTQAANLKAELLVGLATDDPAVTPAAFMTIPATLRTTGVINPGPNEDEYEASFVGTSAGEYAFTYRFSVDNGQNWSYCDLDSTTTASTYKRSKIGYARVFEAASAPNLIDYCNVWQSTLSAALADDSPVVTIETFEAGLTDMTFTGSEIEAEIAYGAVSNNPALPGAYTWNPTLLPYKGPRAAAPNNQEYEGRVYATTAKPAAGAYSVAVRVRRTGTNAWAYCDTNNTTMNFFVDQTTSLTVTP
jgi:hypothetical protein